MKSLSDRLVQAYMRGERIPLKGTATLVLRNEETGEVKIIKKSNMVTHAVADVLSKNYCGLANFGAIQPLKSLFSGCLLFQNTITENADNYNPPNDTVNPLIAHASQQPNDTASLLRGNPVVSDIVETDTSVKWAFSWDTTHGNGTIQCVCLVPDILGSMGLKPFDASFNPISVIGRDSVTGAEWNEEISKQYPFNISADGKTATVVRYDDTTFTEYTIRHDYLAFGIMRSPRTWQDVESRTATIRGGNNRFIFDDAQYYYIARATSGTTLQVDRVSKTDMSVTQADCTFSGVTLWTGNFEGGKQNTLRMFAFDGTHLYYPNGLGNGFLKLNLADNTDATALDGEITIDKGQLSATTNTGEQFHNPVVISPGLILGDNYIINGSRAYQIARTKQIGVSSTYLAFASWLWLVRQGAACYFNAKQTYYNSNASGQGAALISMFLSTINNLEAAVVKSTAQTMTLYYEISEVAEQEGGE